MLFQEVGMVPLSWLLSKNLQIYRYESSQYSYIPRELQMSINTASAAITVIQEVVAGLPG
jgi:hypothetical protein